MTAAPIRIGNASGFYGDRFAAVQEMLTGGELDVLTGDYLAELTMLILARDRAKDPGSGYAKTFLRQLEGTLGLAVDRGVRIVSNAGGLNPAGLAEAIRGLARRLGIDVAVAHVEGDDLLPRAMASGWGKPLAANAYLGAMGIAACLDADADVVVTGRVTDASLVVGPAAARFGWKAGDLDQLAGAVVAGHVIECGAPATGGNYALFTDLLASGADLTHPGFPIAEIRADGSSVITKHPGTGGAVTVGTVTAQLLYEVGGPRYLGPDVVARLDSVQLAQDGADRVRVTGVRGEAPPSTLKVGVNRVAGWRNEVTFVLTGLDVDAKAFLARAQFEAALTATPQHLRWTLVRRDRPDAATQEGASAFLRCEAKDGDPAVVGRAFSAAAVELALAGYPGFHLTAPPSDASPYGVFTPEYVEAATVTQVAVLPDGSRIAIPASPLATGPALSDHAPGGQPAGGQHALGGQHAGGQDASDHDADTGELPPLPADCRPEAPSRRVPLGTVAGARSGDKGGDANLGVWARSAEAYPWLAHTLTADAVHALLPETRGLTVRRHLLANLNAVNLVIEGLLGEGVAAQHRFDPQAKGLDDWLRSRLVDVPEVLL